MGRARLGGALVAQREGEGAAVAALALDADLAAVALDDALGDGQPEAEAEAARLLRLPEEVEHVRPLVGLDAGPGVGDRELHRARAAARAHRERAAVGAEADRVG